MLKQQQGEDYMPPFEETPVKRRVNKYIEARKRQQGGIVKCQNKLISSNSMSGRKFYQSNPELVELYNEEI